MPRKTVKSSQIMARLVEEWNIDFISPSQVQRAMDAIRSATTGLADEVDPKCLIACALELRLTGTLRHMPVECAQTATADNHSIQENGVLSQIARVEPDGTRKVFRFFPTASRLVNLTKGPAGYPGSEWVWNIDRIEPELIPISLASVGHFACGDHDGYTFGPVDHLKIPNWNSYVRIDERNCPKEYRDLANRLFLLAYRTLLHRISQFRGTESVSAEQLGILVKSGNRFGVDSLRQNLDKTADVMTPLYRHKSLFDRRLTGVGVGPLVHHIAPFAPTISYAASEYQPFRHLVGRGKQREEEHAFASCNIYPDQNRTWFIVSYPATWDRNLDTWASNFVHEFTCETPMLRKKQDLECLSSCTNVYASPSDYCALAPDDKSAIETAIARNICEKPYDDTLKCLKRSRTGNELITRIQKELVKEMT